MIPFWNPVSALCLVEPRCFAAPSILRRLLAGAGRIDLLYVGDRMWPAFGDGQRFSAARPSQPLGAGDVVVAAVAGIPDLRRVAAVRDDAVWLVADADPDPPLRATMNDVLAVVGAPRRPAAQTLRTARRLFCELREALCGRAGDAAGDPAASVLAKYDQQAPFYLRPGGRGLAEATLLRVAQRAGGPPARIFVAGCGAGGEVLALARLGCRVKGVDFAPQMIALAQQAARERGLNAALELADLRAHEEPAGAWDAVLFTPDVYSFIPRRRVRIALLQRLAGWLGVGGAIHLSARRGRGVWPQLLRTALWLRGGRREWGDSHTRFPTSSGLVGHSFVHVFTPTGLRREVRAAGLTVVGEFDGLLELTRGAGETPA